MNGIDVIDMMSPELSFEISECGLDLDEVIRIVTQRFPGWKFSRTEARYMSCVMAIFERA